MAAMTKLSVDDIQDDGEMVKWKRISNPQSKRKIEEAKTLNPLSPQNETREEKHVVTMKTDSQDCSICFNPLYPPVNQCKNGHVACPSCWSNLKYNCHMCKLRVQFRNIALEKVLEAAHVPCTYANLGCRKSLCYSQRQVHTDTCEFAPSLCPIPGCAHKTSSGQWQGHFLKDHRKAGIHYSYGRSCLIKFNKEDPYFKLFGPGKDIFLLVMKPIPNVGNALSLYYIDLPDRGKNFFPYELEVVNRENYITSSVQLKSQAVSIKEWKRGEVRGHGHGHHLLVPLGFTEQNMKIHVLINKELGEELDEGLSKKKKRESYEELDEGPSKNKKKESYEVSYEELDEVSYEELDEESDEELDGESNGVYTILYER